MAVMTTKKELRLQIDAIAELAIERFKRMTELRSDLDAMTVDRDLWKAEATRNAADLFAERTKNAELAAANSDLTELVTELRRDITDLAGQVSEVKRDRDEWRSSARQRAVHVSNLQAELADAQRDLGECRELINTERRHADTERQRADDWAHHAFDRSVRIDEMLAVGDRVLAALVKRDPNARRGRPARDWAAVTANYRTEGATS